MRIREKLICKRCNQAKSHLIGAWVCEDCTEASRIEQAAIDRINALEDTANITELRNALIDLVESDNPTERLEAANTIVAIYFQLVTQVDKLSFKLSE